MSESKKKRSRLSAQQRKEKILDAAVALLSEGGARVLTINDVARRADVSRATFYRIFSGIRDVREAIVERVAQVFTERMFTGFGSDNRWVELNAGIEEFLKIVAPLRKEVLTLLKHRADGAIAEHMRQSIASEIARRVQPIEKTELGQSMLRTWIAAAEYQLKDWLQHWPDEGDWRADETGIFARRLALLLVSVSKTFAETADDEFIDEVVRLLDEGRDFEPSA